MSLDLLIIGTYRPDTYYELGRDEEAVKAAKAQALNLFGKTHAEDEPIEGRFRVNFFATPANKGGGFVAHVTVDEYEHLWTEGLSANDLDAIYDLHIEPYEYKPEGEERINNMVRTGSWN